MYLGQMTGEVKMGGYTLKGFHAVEIKKSVHQLIQTAKLTIPASAIMRNNGKKSRVHVAEKIKDGDPISVSFGYNYKNKTEFTGYIRKIDKKIPVVLEIEDAIYLFRKVNIKKTFNSSLKEVLNFLVAEVNKAGAGIVLGDNIPTITVKNFIVKDKTALWALQQLKDWYPMLSIRLIGNKLHCGMLYSAKADTKVKYAINGPQCNVVSVDQLQYNTETQTVKVVWEIKKPNGKIEKKEFGDNNAELVITRKYPGSVNDSILEAASKVEMERATYQGFKGSLVAFLFPEIEPDTIIEIIDPQFGRHGNYYIGTVVTTFDTNGGGRRKPEIDFKLR